MKELPLIFSITSGARTRACSHSDATNNKVRLHAIFRDPTRYTSQPNTSIGTTHTHSRT